MSDGLGTPMTPPADEIVGFLTEVPLFATMSEELRREVVAASEVIRLPAGTFLFREGDAGDTLYALWSGRLEVVAADGTQIDVLRRGAAVGELALLTGDTRTASVRAVRDSEVVAIGRGPFQSLLREDADFTSALTTVLGHRLAGTVRPIHRTSGRVLALVAMTRGVPLDEIAARMVTSVSEWARVGVLDMPDTAALNETELGRALDRCERANDVVVLSAPADAPSAWRDLCLRQADRALLVVAAQEPPPPTVRPLLLGRDLAFWGPRPPAASDSGPWLDKLRPRARYWLPNSQGSTEGLRRAARRIFGRSVGVVLSGGGARALAHVGVIAALLEAGVRIDRFGGSSMGAFVSALFATGASAQDVRDVLHRELARARPFADYTIPRNALIRSHRGNRMFRRVFGDLTVEELPYDWFGVTSDLLTAQTVVHGRGPVRHVVGASMSLPGLAPPMPWAGRLLVDGGVLNNLPVDVMAAREEGPVIAVEVMRRWQQKWEHQRPRRGTTSGAERPPMPSIVETIACATGLGSWRTVDASRGLAALTITPDLPHIGLLDWSSLDEAVAEGRRAASEALERNPAFQTTP